MTLVTTVTLVTVDRKNHVYKTLQQFLLAIGIINDLEAHGSVLSWPLFIMVAEASWTISPEHQAAVAHG